MKPRIVPHKHKVSYNDEKGKRCWKTHAHFKVMFGRKSAGIFWSVRQAMSWIEVCGSFKGIKKSFDTRMEAAKRELESKKKYIKLLESCKTEDIKRLKYLMGKK